jgi:hypothetical protein
VYVDLFLFLLSLFIRDFFLVCVLSFSSAFGLAMIKLHIGDLLDSMSFALLVLYTISFYFFNFQLVCSFFVW